MSARQRRRDRHLIAFAALGLALFDVVFSMFPAPLSGFGEFEDIVPMDALNGSRFVLVVLGAVLFTCVPGLYHGKRMAWAISLACALGSVLAHPLKNVDLWGAVASAGLTAALLVSRTRFRARSDVPTARRGITFLLVGALGVFAYSTVGLYSMDPEFSQPVPFASALVDSVRLMFIVPATAAEPATAHGAWFLTSVRVLVLSVAILSVWHLLQPVIYRARREMLDRARVRTLLEQYGRSSLAFFALLPDKAYFFSDLGNAVLAYKVVGGNCIVMGDPIGDEVEFEGLIESFAEHCALNGWAFAFHQATEHYRRMFEERGMSLLKIGEEGVVDVRAFSLQSHRMKHLRNTMNWFQRERYCADVMAPPHSEQLLARLQEISDEWLSQGNRRERTFTLGSFGRELLQQCEIMVVRDAHHEVVAFANIIPSYRLNQGNFDMLRYAAEPKRVSDLLYVSLISHFRERGYAGMNIGLAPFAGVDVGDARSPLRIVMRALYRHGSALFRYEGLREYKDKFQPSWEPRYLVHGGELQLAGIALAVTRAGELPRAAAKRHVPPAPRVRAQVYG